METKEPWFDEFLSGSTEGWNEFLERYSRLIYKVFNTRSFYFSKEEVEELFQDFMTSLIQNNYHKVRLFEGRNDCSLASYLKKIAINMAIDRRKKLTRQYMTSLNRNLNGSKETDGTELMETVDSGHMVPEQDLINREERRLYRKALYQLEPKKLIIVLLIIYHKYDREALARLMKTSRQNIDVIFNRCKERLKGVLRAVMSEEAREPTEDARWPERIRVYRDRLVIDEREASLERCLKALTSSEDRIAGISFINAVAIEPSPEGLARVYACREIEVSEYVEKALSRLIPRPRRRPKPEMSRRFERIQDLRIRGGNRVFRSPD